MGMTDHWVQIEEIVMAGELRGQGPIRRHFAAVACSKRCAAAALTAAAEAEGEPADPWSVTT